MELFVVSETGSPERPTLSVKLIANGISPSTSEDCIKYFATYFCALNGVSSADSIEIEALLWVNNSFDLNVTDILSPIFAHVESLLFDIILTILRRGFVLSKMTTEELVVLDITPEFGFPLESVTTPISNGMIPSLSPSCIV